MPFRRIIFPLLLLVLACNLATPVPAPPSQPVRTPVPTRTLPFIPPTSTPVPSATPIPSETPIPSSTPLASATPIPSATPTARPGLDPTLGAATARPDLIPEIPIPEPMPQLRLDAGSLNILLLGRDTDRATRAYRTDVIIIASINKTAHSVTLLTLPRDLYVYIPGWTMNRINTAAGYGDSIGYPGGGVALLEQTILYNLGVPIHGWARVDFSGFQNVVDILGGVDVPVTCSMTEWKLTDPAYPLDDQDVNHWALSTVDPGLQHFDGYTALWYARSRKRSSDFDRSRRQHQVLRAMFEKALSLNMLPKLPELYAQYNQVVDTDLGLGDVLQFVPLAPDISNFHIKSRFVGRGNVTAYTTSSGAQVLLPNRDAISALLQEAFLPPADNMLARAVPAVEVWNGAANANWDRLAAENLAWDGIRPVLGAADSTDHALTVLYDFTTSPKGSPRKELQRLFHIEDANVISQPDANAAYPFRVVLGADYNPCSLPAVAAVPSPTAGPPTVDRNIVHAAAIQPPAPPVDGDLTEWSFLVFPLSEPGAGAANRRDAADLSGVWAAAWDDRYLYLAVQTQDDVYVKAPAGEALFRGDSLELWLSSDPSQRTHTLGARDFQLGLSPGVLDAAPGLAEAFLWLPKDQARRIEDVQVGARARAGGYNLEVTVPWSAFGLVPFAGEGFGFTLALNDDDTPASAEQESQVTSVRAARLADPLSWGLLVLDPLPAP